MTRNLVVIGAGMASGRMLETLCAAGGYEITLFNAEPRGNDNRLMLSPVLSGEKTYAQIVSMMATGMRRAAWTAALASRW